ncbi:serine/threonine-protein kinase [Streptomyces sp. TLI_171]|uniref:serine/threonine-protein kinase n=1 Tax=Streptomyces sp. TLI_171 TaxID=1938859 RepID=UPI000C3925F7|nr:serine/threonine-protein kinase [Streptomyces sp. TLI_171]RKE21097.1 serine/threonine protein kinase [Streptomyces sp. TLI_171]
MAADTPQNAVPLPPVFQPLHPDDPREVGGYRLFARLGAGGMGRVYLSYTPGGRPVALKVVRPEFAEDGEFRRRFAQEVSSAQRIHGLYTAQVIDSGGLDAGAPWLVTSYVPGPSLQQVVREHGALPVRTVLLLVGGIAEALQAIHSVEVVHRDLKPANVLVASDGPRVIDFGIARAADATALTGTGYRIGSPAFMSPEQAQGSTVTAATDVFALGALAAYVAGGAPPFGDGPDTAVLYRVVHEEPDLSTVPAPLRELIARCLAKAPQDRPTPAEIIQAAREHPVVGGQLRFGEDWLPGQVNTEITRRSDLPRTPPTPLPAAPAAPPPAPAAPPAQPAFAPQQPPVGAFGPPFPVSEAATAPVPPADPTLLTERHTPPPGPAVPFARPAPPAAAARERRRGVSWKTLLVVSLVTLLAGATGGLVLMNALNKDDSSKNSSSGEQPAKAGAASPNGAALGGSQDQASPSPSASSSARSTPRSTASAGADSSGGPVSNKAVKYTLVYQDTVLSIPPSGNYEFDLINGKVVPDGAVDWTVGTYGAEFRLSSNTDGYISKDTSTLTPEACAAGIDREPAAQLKFENTPADHSFCVRSRATKSIVVLKVVKVGAGDGAATCSLTYYRNDG